MDLSDQRQGPRRRSIAARAGRTRFWILYFGFLASVFCSIAAASSSGPRPKNLGFAAVQLPPILPDPQTIDVASFWVNEREEGERDLNGDGDCCEDRVMYVVSPRRSEVLNLGLSTAGGGAGLLVGHQWIAFYVSEQYQGNTDLNHDGDTSDNVLHVWDDARAKVINLGFAARQLQVGESTMAFTVWEFEQSQDLNGDGDQQDLLTLVYYAPTAQIRLLPNGSSALGVCDTGVLFVRGESPETGDLNGNGVVGDSVYQVMDSASGEIHNLGVARWIYNWPVAISDQAAAFTVSEFQQGADLNGDGDKKDFVLFFYSRQADKLFNLGVALRNWNSDQRPSVRIANDFIGFEIDEAAQGGTDLNGDGDATDAIFAVARLKDRGTKVAGRLTPWQAEGLFRIARNAAAVVAYERASGMDLNGDGDLLDEYAFYIPRSLSAPLPLGQVHVHGPPYFDGTTLVTTVDEDEGAVPVDLNHDGDTYDSVVVLYSPGSRVNTKLAFGSPPTGYSLTPDALYLAVSELAQGRQDLNGDGYVGGNILFRYDRSTGKAQNLRIRVDRTISQFRRFALVTTRELYPNYDLNHDGDFYDSVPFRIDLK